ncbi:hypothetical protein PUN28_009593 [Cardiocondyla obscurior]|uniref:Uncharacterized protein n=1 Tax=Cardiocondyla obscurior TaxID=286306 RepID=A0AAW2FYL3_9HYME
MNGAGYEIITRNIFYSVERSRNHRKLLSSARKDDSSHKLRGGAGPGGILHRISICIRITAAKVIGHSNLIVSLCIAKDHDGGRIFRTRRTIVIAFYTRSYT